MFNRTVVCKKAFSRFAALLKLRLHFTCFSVSFTEVFITVFHCVKSVQIRSFFWSVFSPNARKYGPEKTPYLDTFNAMKVLFSELMTNVLI